MKADTKEKAMKKLLAKLASLSIGVKITVAVVTVAVISGAVM